MNFSNASLSPKVPNLGKAAAFSEFATKVRDWENRHINLKRKLLEYIVERAKRKNLHSISKTALLKIEQFLEEVVDETIESNLDEMKRINIDEELSTNQSFDIDRYKVSNDDDIKILPKNSVAQSSFMNEQDLRYRPVDEKPSKKNWKWDEVIRDEVSPWRLGN